MTKLRFSIGVVLLPVTIAFPVFLFPFTSPQRTAVVQPLATPTAFPLPTQVFPMIPPSDVVEPESFPPEIGELVAETNHLLIHSKYGYFPVNRERFVLEAEEVFDYVSTRLQATADLKIPVLFEPPTPSPLGCPTRGATLTAPVPDEDTVPIIIIYADTNTSHEQVLGVLAHEIGHALQYTGSKQRLGHTDLALNEGLATWAAGQYWNNWKGIADFDTGVRTYFEGAKYLSLHENYDLQIAYSGEHCLESRDILYSEWASFIDFLLSEYGVERFEVLLGSPTIKEAELPTGTVMQFIPADFESVYGLALNQLEAMWLVHINAQR